MIDAHIKICACYFVRINSKWSHFLLSVYSRLEIMSVKEEQLQEIEALHSIYPEEITGFTFSNSLFSSISSFQISTVLTEDPYPEFNLMIKPTSNDEDELRPFLLLHVTFHENYPEQSPKITILESANVDDTSTYENEIQKMVRQEER